MLGKGLESLIPQKGGAGQQNPSSAPSPAPAQAAQNNDIRPMVPPPEPLPMVREPAPAPMPASIPAAEPAPAPVVMTNRQPLIPKKEPAPVQSSVQAQVQPQPQASAKGQESIFHIELEKITPNPDQPRRNFDQEGIRDLANSIREFGLLQPIVVSQMKKETPSGVEVEYQIIAGERRFMAAKMLGLARIPAIVRNVNLEREKLELGVIENIQRENLNPIEMARAFQRLQEEFRMTQREIAAKLGKSREVVANSVRLLDLPEDIQRAVETGEVSESNARMLLALEDPGAQRQLLREIIEQKLTTRDVRERIQRLAFLGGTQPGMMPHGLGSEAQGTDAGSADRAPAPARRGRPPLQEVHLPAEVRLLKDELSVELGAPVEIHKTAHNGRISITFFSEEELENILRKLGGDKG